MSKLWNPTRRVLGALATIALGASALVALTSGPATAFGPGCSGATIEVTTNTDAALRAAFTTANGLAGPQTICIDSGLGTITLGGTELAYTGSATPALTVLGNGITISGNNASRVLNATGPLTLNGVTITGGIVAGAGGGVSANGNVTLTDSTISGNTATTGAGGGLSANGTLVLTNSTISDNTGQGAGGGVWANGTAALTNSTISGNTATTGAGGGLWANGTLVLTNSTISANTGQGDGGGVSANGTAALTNSTISGNTATTGAGGGLAANGTVTLVYATLVQNSSSVGANLDAAGGGLTSFGSVVAQAGGGGANCAVGSTTSNGFNFSDDASAGVSCHFDAATDLVGTSNDPNLGALENNGGPTPTRLPLSGSPLIDAIPLASCQADGASGITTDQRGFPRPALNGCDIGAVELQSFPPVAPVPVPVAPVSVPPASVPAPVAIAPRFTG